MRNIWPTFFLVLLVEFGSATPAFSHHGTAEFDKKNTLTLIGTVTALQLANPHSSVAFDSKDENGNVNHWIAQFGVLRDLVQEGWTDATLKPGDWIKVAIHPKKDGNHSGNLVGEITYADGKPLSLKPLGGQQNYHRPVHW